MDLFLGKAWLFHICLYTPGVRLPPPCWSCVSHWQGARLTRWLKGCLERTGSKLRGVFDPPLSMWQHDSGRNRYWNLFFLLRMLRQKLLDLNGTSIWSKWFVHCTNDINLMIRMQLLRQGNGRLWEAITCDPRWCVFVCVFVCGCVCVLKDIFLCVYIRMYIYHIIYIISYHIYNII